MLDARRIDPGPEDVSTLQAMSELAGALTRLGRFEQAEPLALEFHEAAIASGNDQATEAATTQLITLYEAWHEAEPDDDLPDDYYWHGNEPDLHYAVLPAMLGDSVLTKRAVDLVLDTRYNETEEGLDGNDDAGTLSSWYLFNAVGLYPVVGTPDYVVTSPRFERTEIDREDGTTLVIDADGTGPVTGILLDGENVPLDAGFRFDHNAWMEAETLTLERAASDVE